MFVPKVSGLDYNPSVKKLCLVVSVCDFRLHGPTSTRQPAGSLAYIFKEAFYVSFRFAVVVLRIMRYKATNNYFGFFPSTADTQPCDGPPSRRFFFRLEYLEGVADVTKNCRLFAATSTTCSMLLCVFYSTAVSTHLHPAHPVSAPIRHPIYRELFSHKLRDRHIHGKCCGKILDAYGIPMHVLSGLFSCSVAAGLLACSSRQFAPTINHEPLSASHNVPCCSFLSERGGRQMPPAERCTLYNTTYLVDIFRTTEV